MFKFGLSSEIAATSGVETDSFAADLLFAAFCVSAAASCPVAA
jgi:hypothetical protein